MKLPWTYSALCFLHAVYGIVTSVIGFVLMIQHRPDLKDGDVAALFVFFVFTQFNTMLLCNVGMVYLRSETLEGTEKQMRLSKQAAYVFNTILFVNSLAYFIYFNSLDSLNPFQQYFIVFCFATLILYPIVACCGGIALYSIKKQKQKHTRPYENLEPDPQPTE